MSNRHEKVIVLGGGVGPMAGVELHKRIIENTLTDGTDQSHLEVIHLSRSADIPDRTEYLLGRVKGDPALGMLRTFKMAYATLKAREPYIKEGVGGIPCNTFHAPEIFDRFIELLSKNGIRIKIVNMLDETTRLIGQIAPRAESIGLMYTTGTRRLGIYRRRLEPKGFKIIEVPQEMQDELHDSIYNRQWGIKAVSPITDKAKSNFEKYASILIDKGAQAIILGCTEIPIALPGRLFKGIPLIDPMVALARGLLREANSSKLKPLS